MDQRLKLKTVSNTIHRKTDEKRTTDEHESDLMFNLGSIDRAAQIRVYSCSFVVLPSRRLRDYKPPDSYSRTLTAPLRATMMWSNTEIPTVSPAPSSRRVTLMSCWLGVGSPEG